MSPRRRSGRIAFGEIAGPTESRDALEQFRRAIPAGLPIARYGREWRASRTTVQGQALIGRLGFERQTGTADLWDEDTKDFVSQSLKDGEAVPFAISIAASEGPWALAFQIRPPTIKRTSFTGALQELLREATSDSSWIVKAQLDETSWAEWVDAVDRVDSLRFRLELPNPNWQGRESVQHIVEESNACMVDVVLAAKENSTEGLRLDEEFVAEAIEHTINQDYGYLKAKGERGGRQVEFDSRSDTSPPEKRVPADPVTGEVGPSDLREAIDDRPDG
jgi:hypothetical protein